MDDSPGTCVVEGLQVMVRAGFRHERMYEVSLFHGGDT